MLKLMNELEQVWAKQIETKIAESQNTDVTDYLSLRMANDSVRTTSVKWLFDSMTEIVAFANRGQISISIENQNPHQFEFNKANMVGAILRLRA